MRSRHWAATTTVAPGDVVVTEQNAKQLSQPRTVPDGKPIRAHAAPAPQTPGSRRRKRRPTPTRPTKRDVRTVGPTFLPARVDVLFLEIERFRLHRLAR